jgi:hypothetical protein
MIHSQNLARLSPAEREAFVAALTPREAASYLHRMDSEPAK